MKSYNLNQPNIKLHDSTQTKKITTNSYLDNIAKNLEN